MELSVKRTSALKTEHTRKIYEINAQLKEFKYSVQAAATAKEQAIKIAGQIKTIRDGLCSTCAQTWITDKAKQEEQRLLEELNKHRSIMEAGSNASVQICTLEGTIADTNVHHDAQITSIAEQFKLKLAEFTQLAKPILDPELDILKSKVEDLGKLKREEQAKENTHDSEQNSKNQLLLEEFYKDQKALAIEQEKESSEISKDLELALSVFRQSDYTFKAHKSSLARYQQTFDSLNVKMADMNQKVGHMTSKIGQVTEELEIAEEVKRCLKSYLSCSFDDSLDSISDAATKILRAVPTMANSTVRLEGTKESTSGSVKNQVNACLDSDGEIGIPIKSLSGGERSAVDLAVDLAVSEFIAERSKAGINLLCLDEVMNGFDTFGKECAIEMIKTLGSDRHVLIIEHDPIVKELVSERIVVVRDGETSYIK